MMYLVYTRQSSSKNITHMSKDSKYPLSAWYMPRTILVEHYSHIAFLEYLVYARWFSTMSLLTAKGRNQVFLEHKLLLNSLLLRHYSHIV